MIADFGHAALIIALVAAVYAVAAAWYGARTKQEKWLESGRNATIATLPLILIAAGALVYSLVTNDFSIEYVWRVSSIEQPTYLKVTALWGGQAGSLLFWNLLLAVFTASAMMLKWEKQHDLMPYVIIVSSITQIFFIAVSAFVENPFVRMAVVPPDGNGLNPLLRHPGMIIHPPMLYLGFVGFTIPYAYAMAALISGKLDDSWIKTTRRWTLVAWLFLSLGLVLGGRWAYDVLGWGGYWAWDPVENASLMPWLAGTAFLHSVMIQEKRDMFRSWNMVLIVLTFSLVILGTFTVRSGVISSVHAFAQSAIGPLFFAFIAVMFVFSTYWMTQRRHMLRSKNSVSSLLSREAAFLYNNFLIITILIIVFLFTYYPIFSELVTGERGFVGAPVYEQALGPLFAVLLLLMGVAPLTMWYRSSASRIGMALRWPALFTTVVIAVMAVLGVRNWVALLGFWIVIFSLTLTLLEFWKGTQARMKRGENVLAAFGNLMSRNRRRYGGYWIHIGVLVMGFGIIGTEIYQQETQLRMSVGDTVEIGGFTVQFNGATRYPGPDDLLITEASIDVLRNGRVLNTLAPRTELYTRTNQPMTIPDARSTLVEDLYILLINWEPTSADSATLRIYLNPLINWVWTGGLIFVFGTLIAAWPDPDPKAVRVRKRRPAPAVAGD